MTKLTPEQIVEHRARIEASPQYQLYRAQMQLNTLKRQIADTDYLTLKKADGALTAAEYEPHKQQRAQLRADIRQAEAVVLDLRKQIKGV